MNALNSLSILLHSLTRQAHTQPWPRRVPALTLLLLVRLVVAPIALLVMHLEMMLRQATPSTCEVLRVPTLSELERERIELAHLVLDELLPRPEPGTYAPWFQANAEAVLVLARHHLAPHAAEIRSVAQLPPIEATHGHHSGTQDPPA